MAVEEWVFNPYDPSFRADPVPTYKALLADHPRFQMPLGGWLLTRHADVMKILQHPGVSHDPRNSELFLFMMTGGKEIDPAELDRRQSFLFLDPPDHTRLRGLVSKAFTRRVVEGLRPRIHELVDELIGRALEKGGMEVIEDLAYPLPVTIISEMMGVPPQDHDVFKEWSRELARSLDPEPFIEPELSRRRDEAAQAFRAYFTELIEKRRVEPGDDLLSALIAAEEAGDKLTLDEMLSTSILLLIAGHETTVNLIGNGVLALIRNPAEAERLRSQPGLARGAVEEVLRYDPPVLLTGRVAMEEIDLGDGDVVKEGEQLVVLLGAANRDDAVFEDPHRFDAGRDPNPHVAFGMGIHFCLGAPLARLEGRIALEALVRRVPAMKILKDPPEYRENIVLRGMEALPVGF